MACTCSARACVAQTRPGDGEVLTMTNIQLSQSNAATRASSSPPVPRLPLRLLVFGAMHAGHFAQFITELHAEILGSHLHFRMAISCIRSLAAPASGPSCLHILLIDQHNASIDSLARYYSALRRGCSRGSSRVGRAQTTFHAAPTGPEAPPSYNPFQPTVEE
jgi:hypothetical protein